MHTDVLEPTSPSRLGRMRGMEGRQVSVVLRDGSRLDDCQLVSIGRNRARSIWLVSAGADVFVAADDVVDLWEVGTGHRRVA